MAIPNSAPQRGPIGESACAVRHFTKQNVTNPDATEVNAVKIQMIATDSRQVCSKEKYIHCCAYSKSNGEAD